MSSEENSKAPEAEEASASAPAEEKTEAAAEAAPAKEPAAEAPASTPEAAAEAKPAAADVPAATEPAAVPAGKSEKPASSDDTIRSTTYSPSGPDGGGSHEPAEPEVTERVVTINRCAKVVKGGRRFSFSALVVAGDHSGKVGFGFGKANEVAECIRKASDSAKTSLEPIELRGTTIPHEIIGEFGGGKVLLRPASPGTGIIAGTSVRAVVEAAGITDILTKSLGSNNHFNVVKATLDGLRSLRTRDQIYKLRGKKAADQKAI